MSIIQFKGSGAFSDFRLKKIISKLHPLFPSIETIQAHYVYFIESEKPLLEKESEQLKQLLQASCRIDEVFSGQLMVIPRIGTLSSWSSKATDILHNCGLMQIKRVERGILYQLSFSSENALNDAQSNQLAQILHDPMTESVVFDLTGAHHLFLHQEPALLHVIDVQQRGKDALIAANATMGLALSETEIDYLYTHFHTAQRNPTDAELMMFAQANSEHCRHKIFNAQWVIDERPQQHSLFNMIRHTYQQHSEGVLSAYQDNAAVLMGSLGERFFPDAFDQSYKYVTEEIPIVIKVETHNHPTAISPFPGAATGSGGEIRDEGAVGCGAKPKAGLTGFSVSNLHIPDLPQPWEITYGKPAHIASALDIMLEAPIGAASFNNEFGRPGICGYFRTFEMHMKNVHGAIRGYHKPIMIAGGLGNIRREHVKKKSVPVGAKIIVIGGPAMLIGMGGGAASSINAGLQQAQLDFASVQRSNPEMQRRCQELIDACWALGDQNPILSIHDVGAGGLSNAIPEILHDNQRGGVIDLRAIPNAEPGLSPMEIWCNEAQERYVLAIAPDDLSRFEQLARRERCPFAVVGEVRKEAQLLIQDSCNDRVSGGRDVVDLPLSVLFGNTPKLVRKIESNFITQNCLHLEEIDLLDCATRVLQLPSVADKSFLITIGDRTVGGMVARDQMVGPWQVPVADVAVTASSFKGFRGEAMALGERAPIALIHPAASARMAVGEAITNIACAKIDEIGNIKLSANWMAAAGYPGEDVALYEAVQAIGLELCPALGICIPVGKDSLSMRTVWEENRGKEGQEHHSVTAPLSVIISAFAPVQDIRKTLTPELQRDGGGTELIFIDLGEGGNALGGSALAQVYQQQGDLPPDVDDPQLLKHFFYAIQALNEAELLLAYHDRSDGGLFVTLCEMAFAAHTGLSIQLDKLGTEPLSILFSEELGAVIQIRSADRAKVMDCLSSHHLSAHSHVIGTLNQEEELAFYFQQKAVLKQPRSYFQRLWSETSFRMQALRDNPSCAEQAFTQSLDSNDPGLNIKLTYDIDEDIAAPYIVKNIRPKIAVLREQGVNSQLEMAAAFDQAGFTAVDVHMTDILSGRVTLREFVGLGAGGGFSYGDVLGAGRGWAQSILYHERARDAFSAFFARSDTFTIGICNGCQMLVHLRSIIPGSELWPSHFARNESEQFEARLSLVEIAQSPSIFFKDMAGSRICIPTSHGEGRAVFQNEDEGARALAKAQLVSVQYVNNFGEPTMQYPANPNGSPLGIAALTTKDGRVTLIMPHPERAFRIVQNSWHPRDWQEYSPTMRMFRNARVWVG